MTEPSRAVSRYDGPRTTSDLRDYALALAFDTNPEGQYKRNDALPVAFRGNPGAVAFAVEYAKALDVSPITALIGIHIVDGKPTASAGLISALVRRAGHKIRTYLEGSIEEGNAVGVTEIVREDDPEFTYISRWTIDRAVRANLMKREGGRVVAAKPKSAWATYPENMLKARSLTECARDAAEDAILGVHYTPEELGVDVDQSGEPVYTVTQVENPTVTPTPRGAAPDPAPAGETQTPPAGAGTSDEGTTAVVETPTADDVRDALLSATAVAELHAIWAAPPILKTTANAVALVCGDEHGQETNAFELFKRANAAILSGRTLTGEEIPVEAVVVEEGDANLVDLERLLARMGDNVPRWVEDVKAWATLNEIDLDTRDNAVAGTILDSIASGEAFTDNTIRETLDETPAELVTRLLGATTIHEHANGAQQQHEHELAERARQQREEDHADAVAARAASGGPATPEGTASIAAAREAARAARSTD